MNYEKHFSRYAQGLPAFFPGGVSFAPVDTLKTVGIGKNKLRQFKAQALMFPLVALVFVIIPFNIYPLHD
jgi:hypothetical protein